MRQIEKRVVNRKDTEVQKPEEISDGIRAARELNINFCLTLTLIQTEKSTFEKTRTDRNTSTDWQKQTDRKIKNTKRFAYTPYTMDCITTLESWSFGHLVSDLFISSEFVSCPLSSSVLTKQLSCLFILSDVIHICGLWKPCQVFDCDR